ncbi:MAG: hypothetical protein ACYCUV_05095 [Phycisphaerae bacterium]
MVQLTRRGLSQVLGLLGVDPLIIGLHGRVHAHPTLTRRYVPLPQEH